MPAYVQNKAEAQFVFGAMVTSVDNDRQYVYVRAYTVSPQAQIKNIAQRNIEFSPNILCKQAKEFAKCLLRHGSQFWR